MSTDPSFEAALHQFLQEERVSRRRLLARGGAAGLALTGHFLLERVLVPHGKEMPPARLRLDTIAVNESH